MTPPYINFIAPVGGGGGGTTIIENFDTLALPSGGLYTGLLTWRQDRTVTVTLSDLHVTQGTHSWQLTGSDYVNLDTGSYLGFSVVDLSAYSSISVDLYAEATDEQVHYGLFVGTDFTNFDTFPADNTGMSAVTVDGFTGATTLTLDLTSAMFDLSDVIVSLYFYKSFHTPDINSEVFWDNLIGTT